MAGINRARVTGSSRGGLIRRVVPVALLAVLAVVACGTTTPSTGGKAKTPAPAATRIDNVRLAGSNVGLPQPFTASAGGGGITLMSLLFDTLTWQNPQGKVVPMLATGWKTGVGGDATKIDFTLRSGVKWSDGQPFTADDVVFTWQYQRQGQPGYAGSNTASAFSQVGVTNVVALSPTLVEFTTSAPDATFLFGAATRNFIFPKHVWETVTNAVTYADPAAFVGTGPYTLGGYSPAQSSYQFLAKDSHFLGKPYVREIDFVPAPDPLQALQAGLIDLADVGTGTYLPAQIAALDPSRFGKISAGGILTYGVMFNMTQYPYNDVRFRQAMAWAIDRADFASRLFPLGGNPTNLGMLQPNQSFWVPSDTLGSKMYAPASASKAAALLDAVGLTIPAGQTMRFSGGTQFRPTIMVTGSTDAFNIVRQDLLAVGIDPQVQVVSSAQLNTNATSGSYQMILRSYGASSDPNGLLAWLSSTSPMVWWHSYGWSNSQFESLYQTQRTQFNATDRQQTAYQIERLIATELPQLFLAGGDRIVVFNKSIPISWNFPSPVLPGGPAGNSPAAFSKLHFIFQNPSATY